MVVLNFDIEASNLNADFGVVLCVGVKELGKKKVDMFSVRDYKGNIFQQEKQLLKDVRRRLLEGDVWVAHFGRWFDTVFINSRLLYHGLKPLPTDFPLVDTWRIAKNHLKLHSNRLVSLQEFLHLPTAKNAIKSEQWILALAGHQASLAYIEEHCRLDVEVLEETYIKIRPLIANHPGISLNEKCLCGGNRQKRGFHYTKSGKFQRFQCVECGAWSRSNRKEKS